MTCYFRNLSCWVLVVDLLGCRDTGPSYCDEDRLNAISMTERACSDSVQKPVVWPQFPSDLDCRPQPLMEGCRLRWGCDDFATARSLVSLCNSGPHRWSQKTGRIGEFLVVEELDGSLTVRGYYDASTGELVGYWEMNDTGEEVCSGTVLRTSLSEAPLDEVEALCARDGGPLAVAADGG